jgi:hypothetical protein
MPRAPYPLAFKIAEISRYGDPDDYVLNQFLELRDSLLVMRHHQMG